MLIFFEPPPFYGLFLVTSLPPVYLRLALLFLNCCTIVCCLTNSLPFMMAAVMLGYLRNSSPCWEFHYHPTGVRLCTVLVYCLFIYSLHLILTQVERGRNIDISYRFVLCSVLVLGLKGENNSGACVNICIGIKCLELISNSLFLHLSDIALLNGFSIFVLDDGKRPL